MHLSRPFLISLRFFCIALQLSTVTICQAQDPSSPRNVLLIIADDLGTQAGYLGTTGVRTPTIDSLASKGVAFKKAYCTFPSCSPSRAGILTGTHPHVNGIASNVFEFFGPNPPDVWLKQSALLHKKFHVRDSIATLVEVLKNAGYYTGITGKFHMAPHAKFPFEYWSKNFAAQEAKQFFASRKNKPFFLVYNSSPPHRPFVTAADAASVEAKLKEGKLSVPAFLPNTALMQRDWAEYLVAIEKADKRVQFILAMLKESGMDKNTLVIFLGDNGAPFHRGKYSPYDLGNHCPLILAGPGVSENATINSVVSFADVMPTVLDILDIKIPAAVNGKSLKPYLLGKSDIEIHDYVVSETAFSRDEEPGYQARSLFTNRFLYIRSNGKRRVKRSPADMYEEKGWNNHSYKATMEAKDEYMLQYSLLQTLENTPPVEELFDLHSDPWCMHDISKSKEYDKELKALRKRLDEWIAATNDTEMMKN